MKAPKRSRLLSDLQRIHAIAGVPWVVEGGHTGADVWNDPEKLRTVLREVDRRIEEAIEVHCLGFPRRPAR